VCDGGGLNCGKEDPMMTTCNMQKKEREEEKEKRKRK